METFNVFNNNFSGRIPPGGDRFTPTSYLGNPKLCGVPLPNKCENENENESATPNAAQNSNSPGDSKKSGTTSTEILMYSGYAFVGLALIIVVVFKVCKRGKQKEESVKEDVIDNYQSKEEDASATHTFVSNELKSAVMSKSEVIVGNSVESAPVSSSLIVLTSPEVNGLSGVLLSSANLNSQS